MNNKFFKEKYQMYIAGKVRTFDNVTFKPSKFNPNNVVLPHTEFTRMSKEVIQELLTQKHMLDLEEVEFLRYTLKVPHQEVREILHKKPFCSMSTEKSQAFQELFKKKLSI